MKASKIYTRLNELSQTDDEIKRLIVEIHDVYRNSVDISKTIIRYMPQYTLHDEEHILRTIELMDGLLPEETLERLTPLELAGLLITAALHDIGMAPSENEVRTLLVETSDELQNNEDQRKFRSFCSGYQSILQRKNALVRENRFYEAQELNVYLLSEYIRQTHGERGRTYIFENYKNQLVYAHNNYAHMIANICFSHTQDSTAIHQIPCWELVRAPGEYVNWRFISVVLRLADILDFDAKRTPQVLFNHLGIREGISLKEWKKHRSVKAWDISPGRIAFSAKCPDPVIQKTVLDFINQIEDEINTSCGILGGMSDPACQNIQNKYFLPLPARIDTRNIGPEEGQHGKIYKYLDLSFSLDYENIISLIMGISLYGNKALFLRELLQNAVDACKHKKEVYETNGVANEYTPEIIVELHEINGNWFLSIEDNGMGMDEAIVSKYFAQIGNSYYQSEAFLQEKARLGLKFQPISKFGIGVLSVFMATKKLKVETRRQTDRYSYSDPIEIEIDGPSSLFWLKQSRRDKPGTRLYFELLPELEDIFTGYHTDNIVITLGEDAPKQAIDIRETIASLAPHVELPVYFRFKQSKYKLPDGWVIPGDRVYLEKGYYKEIALDLTMDCPKGLDGYIKLYLLIDSYGGFSKSIRIEEEPHYSELRNETLYDTLEQEYGYVEHLHRGVMEGGDIALSYSTELDSKGRLSQDGFLVPQSLFEEGHSHRFYIRKKYPLESLPISYPFVIRYDINLSGDYTVNLTADRLRIIPDNRYGRVRSRICESITRAFLNKLGKETTKSNLEFFMEVLKKGRGEIGLTDRDYFRTVLEDFLK